MTEPLPPPAHPNAGVSFLLIPLGGVLFARSRRGDDGRVGD
ncbi:MAG TPA: hypothetical protein VK935_04365 [Actinomycetospora sp.]|nr:hypothetical protein [Actinomycetospora sp.]